jgi:NH3-dependent NAD+ synthetase
MYTGRNLHASADDRHIFPATIQEEFYFSLRLEKMDLCLYGKKNAVPAASIAAATGLTATEAERVYALIDAKRIATRYLHQLPILVESAVTTSHPAG